MTFIQCSVVKIDIKDDLGSFPIRSLFPLKKTLFIMPLAQFIDYILLPVQGRSCLTNLSPIIVCPFLDGASCTYVHISYIFILICVPIMGCQIDKRAMWVLLGSGTASPRPETNEGMRKESGRERKRKGKRA